MITQKPVKISNENKQKNINEKLEGINPKPCSQADEAEAKGQRESESENWNSEVKHPS